jgi:hypothetical protein
MKKIVLLLLLFFSFLVSFSQVKRTTTKRTTKPATKPAAKTTTKTVKKPAAKPVAKTTAKVATTNNKTNTNSTNTSTSNTGNSNTSTTSNSYTANKKDATVAKNSSTGAISFTKGGNVLDLGIGFSGYGIPFHAGFEHFFSDDISAGVFLNFASYRRLSIIWGGVKGNYHFNKILKLNNDKVDLSAGASIGYWSVGNSGISSSFGNTVFFGIQIGGRYYFSDKIGAFAEFGGGNLSGGLVGVTIKF